MALSILARVPEMLGGPILTGRFKQKSDGRRGVCGGWKSETVDGMVINATYRESLAKCDACPSGDPDGLHIAGRSKSARFGRAGHQSDVTVLSPRRRGPAAVSNNADGLASLLSGSQCPGPAPGTRAADRAIGLSLR
jgi:hypothetical protein